MDPIALLRQLSAVSSTELGCAEPCKLAGKSWPHDKARRGGIHSFAFSLLGGFSKRRHSVFVCKMSVMRTLAVFSCEVVRARLYMRGFTCEGLRRGFTREGCCMPYQRASAL